MPHLTEHIKHQFCTKHSTKDTKKTGAKHELGTSSSIRGLQLSLDSGIFLRETAESGAKKRHKNICHIGQKVSRVTWLDWREMGPRTGKGHGLCQNSYSWTTAWRASKLHGEKPRTNLPCADNVLLLHSVPLRQSAKKKKAAK